MTTFSGLSTAMRRQQYLCWAFAALRHCKHKFDYHWIRTMRNAIYRWWINWNVHEKGHSKLSRHIWPCKKLSFAIPQLYVKNFNFYRTRAWQFSYDGQNNRDTRNCLQSYSAQISNKNLEWTLQIRNKFKAKQSASYSWRQTPFTEESSLLRNRSD